MLSKLKILAAAMFIFTGLAGSQASAQIVALGASNTEGYGVGSSSAYPALIENMMRAKGRAVTVTNAGIYGNTSGELLDRVDRDVPQGTRLVILSVLAGNDVRRGGSIAQARMNGGQIIAKLNARRIKVVLANAATFEALRAGYTQRDGIHLTEQGHQYVASKIFPQVFAAYR